VDPNHYDGWSGPLGGCENDANDMAAIAGSQGYASTLVLLTQQATAGAELGPCSAGVILISGCQDNEVSWDGSANGLFTQTLKHVWSNGGFSGDYGSFHRSIKQYLVGRQNPNFFRVGNVTKVFRKQKPFTI
jgi:hypothetical protein